MQFTLRSHPTAQRPACAAFLRGADAGAWLREIGRWGLAAEQLSCYLVPESIHSVRVAGLLVVAQDGAALPADVLEPYGAEAGRLYLPVQATLWPPAAPEELATALLWPRQLWHPAIGLVGFAAADELDLTALLDCPAPRPTDWARALPGPAPKAPLRQLRVEAPSAEDVLAHMRQDVASTPLSQLTPAAEARPSGPRRLLHGLRRGTLRAGLWVVQRLRRWFDGPSSAANPLPGAGRTLLVLLGLVGGICALLWLLPVLAGKDFDFPWVTFIPGLIFLALRLLGRFGNQSSSAGSGRRTAPRAAPARPAGPGALARLQRWLGGSLADLENQRTSEIERLLRLFGENPAEALKYAIPLGGPYQGRGQAPASGTLGPRDATFSLGGLLGGGAVDTWNVDYRYQQSLRQQYQAAAEQEARAGRHQKAAYIYAHLLSDFAAAARVLEQGGLFREAAALHRDHLHNPTAAAECLERGGLLLEAATLYAELHQHEQAGDLYQQLDQHQLAARHYERATELHLSSHDHHEAALLLHHKLRDEARARQVLLQGWAADRRPERCLQTYFDVAATAPAADLSAEVRAVYQAHTPAERRVPLLQVLAQLTAQHPTDEPLLTTSRELAYEVVGREAAAGHPEHLPLLRPFLPDDRLLPADLSRFATGRQRRLTDHLPAQHTPQLDASISWLHAVSHGPQWVAVGRRDNRLHLARATWHGHVEYYSWTTGVPDDLTIWLVADEQLSSRLLLRATSSTALTLDAKHLPKNKYFPLSLTVEAPSWLPPYPAQVALLPDGGVAATQFGPGDELRVLRYQKDGQPLTPLVWPRPADLEAVDVDPSAELRYHDGQFYSHWGNLLLVLPEKGEPRALPLEIDRPIFHLTYSAYAPWTTLALSGEEMLILWQPGRDEPHITWIGGLPVGGDLRFVGPLHLVAARDEEAALYELDDYRPRQVQVIEAGPSDAIVAVLTTSQRQQFALLHRSGRVTLHAVPSALSA